MEYLGEVPDRDRHTVVRMTGREYQALGALLECMWHQQGTEGQLAHRQDVAKFLELARKLILHYVPLREQVIHVRQT